MALAATAVWELNASATASNVNAGYFNPANASMATDLTTDSNTGNTNSPVVSSASYNFVAGDVGALLYIQSGTNWRPGWYQIASVAANKATLSAAIGQAIVVDAAMGSPYPKYEPNPSAGVASVGTPTGGVWTVDYSQSTAANNATTNDLASLNGTTNPSAVSSITYNFGVNTVGNGIHVTAGTNWTQDWYEIVSVSLGLATLDKACGSAAALTVGTWRIGGAMSLNSTIDDDLFEKAIAGNTWFVKRGSFTLGENVNVSAVGTTLLPINIAGYNATRGDNPAPANQPTINVGSGTGCTFGGYWTIINLIFTGTSTPILGLGGTGARAINCTALNTSTTVDRLAFSIAVSAMLVNCNASSIRGTGITTGSNANATCFGNYIHDCNIGWLSSTASFSLVNNIFENCVTAGLSITGGSSNAILVSGNTFYGSQNKQGTGILFGSTGSVPRVVNNIFYGFATGVSAPAGIFGEYSDYNDYFNNTADVSVWLKGDHDIAINPSFTNMAQLTGATATTAGSVLTQSGGDFSSVTDNVDYIRIVSGTGVTAGIYPITSHTGTTVTSSVAFGTDATTDKVWQITTGHNLGVGTALKATAYPGVFNGSSTTGYLDIGAAQRQEPAGGSGSSFTFGT